MVTRVTAWAGVLSSTAAVGFWVWALSRSSLPFVSLTALATGDPGQQALVVGGGLAWAITGAVLLDLRPRNGVGWLFLAVGVAQAWSVALTAYGWFGGAGAESVRVLNIAISLGRPSLMAPPTLLLALYPSGRLPGHWWRWPAGGVAIAMLYEAVTPLQLFPRRLNDLLDTAVTLRGYPIWPVAVLFWLSMLSIWAGTVVRLVHAQPPLRQQLAWLMCGVMPFWIAWNGPSLPLPFLPFGSVVPSLPPSVSWVGLLFGFLVPVVVAVSALRYRPLGVEAVLRRSLVYGTFTAVVVGAYLVVTVLAGSALDRRPLPGVVAAALVAAALAPARDRLQRVADRLVHGDRRDPLRAVAQLGHRVTVTDELDLLPAALTSVMGAVGAPGASVVSPDGRVVGRVGDEMVTGISLPLGFGGRQVGALRVARRSAGEAYTGAELRLLRALAPQVAVVVRALTLTEELQTERDQVVAATGIERDRLRRELHDGLGPSLSGVGLGLQGLADLLDRTGPDTAAAVLLDRIRAEVVTAVGEVRCIIDGLRPAALDTMRLTEAIRRHAETISAALPVDVIAADLPPLPSQVETAAYRITTEALTNAVRHAHAHRAQVTLAAPDSSLRIIVSDDGHGVGTASVGVGLTSMRRRAEALGGRLDVGSATSGTTVTVTLPLDHP